jgi:AP2 domain./HNH endonuclease.
MVFWLIELIEAHGGKKGARVGYKTKIGYLSCTLDRMTSHVHRVIYIMHNGDIPEGLVIDHINGKRDDNRIENLRIVTPQENQFNRLNAKGYHWNKHNQKYLSSINGVDGVRMYLGSFDDKEDARKAYADAKAKYHIIEKRGK